MAVESRIYTTRRNSIVTSIKNLIESSLSTSEYPSNIGEVHTRIKFFDDLRDFPAICIIAGQETRDYQAGGYKDKYLNVRIMIFVNEDNALNKCEEILEDLETLIEENSRLSFTNPRTNRPEFTKDITINSISTDEGALDPIAVGEIGLVVYY